MSTRSGKRIHSAYQEDAAPPELEPASKSERKPRNKRVKEKLDELNLSLAKNKKRINYVTYPRDDELLQDTPRQDDETKQIRILRKYTLKEQNPIVNSEVLDSQTNTKSLVRKSTRGKKVADHAAETENNENVPAEVAEIPKSKKSKKNKNTNTVMDNPPSQEAPVAASKKIKKKKKKGKKISSTVEDGEHNNQNQNLSIINNMSIDSFHSAAGSPGRHDMNRESNKLNTTLDMNEDTNKKSTRSSKKTSKGAVLKRDVLTTNTLADDNDEGIIKSKARPIKRKSFRKSFEERLEITKNNLKNDVANLMNIFNFTNGHIIRTRSSTKYGTLDASSTSATNDIAKDDETNVNVSNVHTQVNRRRSSIKEVNDVTQLQNMVMKVDEATGDDTFDRETKNSSKDVSTTYENVKTDEVIDLNGSNMSNKHLRSRRSSIKDNTSDVSSVTLSFTREVSNKQVDLNVSNMSNKQLKTRRSLAKETSFDKSSASIKENKDEKVGVNDSKMSNKYLNKRKSVCNDTSIDTNSSSIRNGEIVETVTDLDESHHSNINPSWKRRSNIRETFDKPEQITNTTNYERYTKSLDIDKEIKRDTTFDRSNSKHLDATYEKDIESDSTDTSHTNTKDKKSCVNTTYDKSDKGNNTTFEKDVSTSFDSFKKGAMSRKSSIREAFERSNTSMSNWTREDIEKDINITCSSAMKMKLRRSTYDKNEIISENVTPPYEKTSDNELSRRSTRSSIMTADIQTKLNTTFEKDSTEYLHDNGEPKSSLMSSDNSETSHISIISDDAAGDIENIVNTTPVLIESSMDESQTLKPSPQPITSLTREGTFTKDGPEVQAEPGTPPKHDLSPPKAGCTPYHASKSSPKKRIFNVTRSLEKGRTPMELAPRLTRVMFCSPVNNPVMIAQEKKKIIKSNLKGSNKSFVFEDSAIVRPGRKRSFTHNDADDSRVKRTRLAGELQQSVDRLSRPRTSSATAKLSVPGTPSKKPPTPAKPRSDGKPPRTRLPNFAAVHQKNFDKMESLNECQERRAKRAKQLLTPTAPPGLLDRISPKSITESPKPKEPVKPIDKTDTPTKKLPTLESLRPGFTRFGFKLNLDVNPFSIPSKTEKEKLVPKVDNNTSVVPRAPLLPSLAGATSGRREVAKLTVMREKSFTGRRNVNRNENRTIIKGVRTNRRFELQMKMRNID